MKNINIRQLVQNWVHDSRWANENTSSGPFPNQVVDGTISCLVMKLWNGNPELTMVIFPAKVGQSLPAEDELPPVAEKLREGSPSRVSSTLALIEPVKSAVPFHQADSS